MGYENNRHSSGNLTAAVVTSTIGRESLTRTIESIQHQTYPCKHYIFVDGQQYHDQVKALLRPYPNVIVTYLPMSTGANGMCNSVINALASLVISEDVICFVDDDNWVDEKHVEHLVSAIAETDAEYAYSLRYFISPDKQKICEDNYNGIGFWCYTDIQFPLQLEGYNATQISLSIVRLYTHLIDTNSYAIKRKTMQMLIPIWLEGGDGNDLRATRYLFENQVTGVCTGKRTVYYSTMIDKILLGEFLQIDDPKWDNYQIKWEILKGLNRYVAQSYEIMPWTQKTLFKNGELIVLE